MRLQVQSLALLSGLRSQCAVNCGVGCRRGSDPVLLWHRPAAKALIGPLAWEPPYAMGAALKNKKQCPAKEGSKSSVLKVYGGTHP